MDHGYTPDRPLLELSPDLVASSARVTSFLAGSGRAVVLSGPSGTGKFAVADQLLAGMSGRVLRVRNQGSGPLDLTAILHQLGHVAQNEADEQGLFFRTLAALAYDDHSAVLMIEDAHTLTSFALSALSRVPGLGGPDLPGMILVLSGEPSLLPKLAAPGLEVLRNSRRTLLLKLASPDKPPGTPVIEGNPSQSLGEAANLARRSTPIWRDIRLVVLAVTLGVLGAAAVLPWMRSDLAMAVPPVVAEVGSQPTADPPAPPTAPAASASAAPAVAPFTAEAAAKTPDPSPGLDAPVPQRPVEAQLRREFDAFLNHAGSDTAKLTPVARERLFQEYLRSRRHDGVEPVMQPRR